jgi:hypothetical protein
MNTATKVAAFLVGLLAIFGIALGVGKAVGPTSDPASVPDAGHDMGQDGQAPGHDMGQDGEDTGHDMGHMGHTPPATVEADIPGGLMVSQNGYTLELAEQQATPGRDVAVSFTIEGPDGRTVTEYDVQHDKRLHLIAVRRDATGFQHVHPHLTPDGVWSTRLDLKAGQWRLFADFKAAGADPLTLGADLAVPGDYRPARRSKTTRTAHVDGYTVTLDGDLTAGADAKLTLSVFRGRKPVTDLQPYLAAYGHLVALRDGDLAYLHVHPDGEPNDGTTKSGPDVVFHAAVPSAGVYHLFLDFQHRGVVRTAEFTLPAAGTHG